MKGKLSTIKIAKYLIGFYFAYNVFLIPIGFFIPRLSIVILFLAGLLTLSSYSIRLTKEFRNLIFFIIYAFFTGLIVAVDHGMIIGKTKFLVESVISGIILLNVTNDENDFRTIVGLFALGAIILGVYSFFNLDYLFYSKQGRLSLGEDFNANTYGVMLMYGVWSIVFFLGNDTTKIVRMAVIVFLSLLLLYIIIQTGSRKSAIGSLLILVSYAIIVVVGGGASKYSSKVIIIPLFIGLIVFAYFRYIDDFLEKSETLVYRMRDIGASEENRGALILDTLRVWSENPLFGVGIDNNRYHTITKMYAHNSYVEILACTGVFGAIIFFTIFWRMISFLIVKIKKVRQLFANLSEYYLCILILVYLFVCFTQINIYNQTHMFITFFILTFISISSKNNEKSIRSAV